MSLFNRDASNLQHLPVAWYRRPVPSFLSIVFAAPLGLATVSYINEGPSVAEKILTSFSMPLTVIPLILFSFALVALLHGRLKTSLMVTVVFVLLYCSTSPLVATYLMRQLEHSQSTQLLENAEALDTLVVLGGGTGVRPDHHAQLANSGDRIDYAARLYHRGLVKHVVVTGDVLPGGRVDDEYSPAKMGKEILLDLGVKSEDISTLPGVNTSFEIKSLHDRPELWQGKRCGVLTSAFHLPRAMRLAKSQDLELIPLACDYRSDNHPFTFRDLIPSGNAATSIELVIKEHLASIISR